MSKILNQLQKQLSSEYKEDAEEVLEIYKYMYETTGHFWDSDWRVLVHTSFVKDPNKHPINYDRKYSLTLIGKLMLKGLQHEKIQI